MYPVYKLAPLINVLLLVYRYIYIYLYIFFTLLLSSFWTRRGSQVSPLLPPGSCLQFLSRLGFSNPSARDFSSSVASSRSRAFRMPICAQEKGLLGLGLGAPGTRSQPDRERNPSHLAPKQQNHASTRWDRGVHIKYNCFGWGCKACVHP